MSSVVAENGRVMRRRLIIVVIAAGVLLAAIVGFNTWKANFRCETATEERGASADRQCGQRAIHRLAAGGERSRQPACGGAAWMSRPK